MKLNHIEKARKSKIVIPIKCHICKRRTIAHLFSYCANKELCIECANQEVEEDFH